MSALRGSPGLTAASPAGIAVAPDAPAGVRPMPAGDPEQIFFHFDLRRALQMHRKLAAGIFAAAALIAAAYMVKQWDRYSAQALVYVQPAPPRLMPTGVQAQWPFDANTYESFIQQQIHDVTRRDVLVDAMHRLPGWQRSGESEQVAAARLERSLEVSRVGSGYQIEIASKAKSAAEAAQIANAVSASFIESATRELRAGDMQRIELLRDERDRVQKELASDRTEQDDLNRKLGVASLGGAPDPVDEQITAVRAELVKARTDNDEAAARLTALGRGVNTSAAMDAEADDLVSADPAMVSLKQSLSARRSALISEMANLTPNHPAYKQDADELAKINSTLESMSKDLRVKAAAHIEQKLKNDLERTSSVEARLNGQLAQLTAAAGTAGPRLQRLNDLATDVDRLQRRFAVVDDQYRNLMLESKAPGAVYLSASAVPPAGAMRELMMRNGFVILLVGLLFALGAAMVAQNLDQRIYIATDVERVLGFTPMAQLPDFAEVAIGVGEEYMLRLAAALEHAYQEGSLKSCIFTGVAPGAGTTTVATRVTSMLEAMGRSTVLVDASAGPGSSAMPGGNRTETGTDIVPAQRGSRSTALLQQMAEETGEDTIVMSDTAPLLVSGETEYLARFVDSAIVVVESGVTTRAQLRDVAHTLQRLDVSAVGFVLNRISKQKANPSFRESVRAVEQHLYGQARARAREENKQKAAARAKKKPQGDDPEPPQGKPQDLAAQAAASSRIVTPDPPADGAAPASTPVSAEPVRAADPVIPAVQEFATDPAKVQASVPPTARLEAYAKRLRGRSLRHAAHAPASNPTPVPAPAAAEAKHEQEATAAVPPPPVPEVVQEARTEPVAAPSVAPPVQPVERKLAPAPEHIAVASANPAAMAEAAMQAQTNAPEGNLHDLPYSAASRLGGLRNLLVSLGLQSLNRESELRTHETAPAPEPRQERTGERPVYAEPPAPLRRASDPESPAPEAAEVIAQPEFLPPKPLVEIVEKEKEPEPRPTASPRKNRWDSDDIDTLPSWRGQYRKKR